MNLEEAIKRAEQAPVEDEHIFSPDLRDALKLLIEAGKRVIHVRETYQKSSYVLLPGETL